LCGFFFSNLVFFSFYLVFVLCHDEELFVFSSLLAKQKEKQFNFLRFWHYRYVPASFACLAENTGYIGKQCGGRENTQHKFQLTVDKCRQN
jgi:hypothetical protein